MTVRQKDQSVRSPVARAPVRAIRGRPITILEFPGAGSLAANFVKSRPFRRFPASIRIAFPVLPANSLLGRCRELFARAGNVLTPGQGIHWSEQGIRSLGWFLESSYPTALEEIGLCTRGGRRESGNIGG